MNFILKHRLLIIIAAVILTGGIAVNVIFLERDASITSVLPSNDPDFKYNREIEDIFGSSEEIVFSVTSEDPILSPGPVNFISVLTGKLSELPDIKADGITSLTKSLEPLAGTPPEPGKYSEEDVESLKRRLSSNPLLRDRLISDDGLSTMILAPVSVEISYSDSELNQLIASLKELVEETLEDYQGIEVLYSGHPVVKAEITRYMANDLYKLFPGAIAAVMLIIMLMIRSVRGTLIPIMVTILSVIWTFGLKGLLRSPLTLTETVIPVALISIACASGIHIVNQALHYMDKGHKPLDAVKDTMSLLGMPVVLTSLTTAIGFASLIWSPGTSLKNMGLFLAFGVLMAMIFSLTIVPAVISYYRPHKHHHDKKDKEKKKDRFHFLSFIRHTTTAILKHKYIAMVITIVLFGLSFPGILNINTDTDEVRYFKENAPVRIATEHIEEHLGGISTVYLIVTTPEKDGIFDPDILRAIDEIQTLAGELPNVIILPLLPILSS